MMQRYEFRREYREVVGRDRCEFEEERLTAAQEVSKVRCSHGLWDRRKVRNKAGAFKIVFAPKSVTQQAALMEVMKIFNVVKTA